jgi:hypothetical protein
MFHVYREDHSSLTRFYTSDAKFPLTLGNTGITKGIEFFIIQILRNKNLSPEAKNIEILRFFENNTGYPIDCFGIAWDVMEQLLKDEIISTELESKIQNAKTRTLSFVDRED